MSIPFNGKNEYVREFKQAHRRDDDIAIVNAGMRVHMTRAMSGSPRKPFRPCLQRSAVVWAITHCQVFV